MARSEDAPPSVEERIRRTLCRNDAHKLHFIETLLRAAPDRFTNASSPIYGVRNFATGERHQLSVDNFSFFLDALHADGLELLHGHGLTVWSMIDSHGHCLIDLAFSRRWANEGEQTMTFRFGGATVFELAFMVSGARPGADGDGNLLVTRLQGSRGCGRLIGEATRMLGGVHPAYALISAASGIVAGLDLDGLFAVSAGNQIAYREDLSSAFHQSYDGLFAAIGGVATPDGFFELVRPLWSKPLSQIERSHRRRTSQRRALKLQIERDAAAAVNSLVDYR